MVEACALGGALFFVVGGPEKTLMTLVLTFVAARSA
jgi:hypothetical protein